MKILYLTFSDPEHSLNAVYIKGLRQNGVEVRVFSTQSRGLGRFVSALKFYWANRKGIGFIMIGADSPGLVIPIRLFSFRKIVFNAASSVYERMIVSRGLASRLSPKALYYWKLDFLACWFSSLVMLESEHQIRYFQKLFWLPRKKTFLALIGVDEEKFFYDDSIKKFEEFTVIFRGRLLPEAGGEYVVRAAKKLEDTGIKFIMHAFGQELPKIKQLVAELQPKNLKLITDFLPIEEVREMMQKSHLSLGQLSDNPRLERTIPHKAYESLALKLPYLTAGNKAVLELLREGETCLVCRPADAEDLAEKIIWANNNPRELERIAERGFELYKTELTAYVLAKNLLARL